MTFKPRQKKPRPTSHSTDAKLALTVFTTPQFLPRAEPKPTAGTSEIPPIYGPTPGGEVQGDPEGSPLHWSEIVSRARTLEGTPILGVPYLKQRLSRGLRQLKAAGEVERVKWGLYRLNPATPPVGQVLSELLRRVERLTEALSAPRSDVPPWLIEVQWYALRDRFKDAALGVERELMKAGTHLKLPTAVRVIESSDGQAANRRVEVRFQAETSESMDPVTRAHIEHLRDSRLRGVTVKSAREATPEPEKSVRGSGPGAQPSSRSKRRRTPTRRRAASVRPRRGQPARGASRRT